ncbi:galactose-3-O-sulfotransferase 2-like isoform X1 [Lacerta agilis]|uniref:galactose-3-O-sulfotransferase 2-like isoform X1 n=1 Tax=Lacerta agilis TaxID=80427 RepID=UPI00141956D4|nr:galactose-3-O-sulfotransferase 2-like isoform X1 [Lacerta agilis]
MCKLTRTWIKKWKLSCNNQLGRLWVALLLLFLLCIIFQVAERFQCTSNCRCNFKQNQLPLEENRASENSIQVQRSPTYAQLLRKSTPQEREPSPNPAEKKRLATKLNIAFNKTKLLAASLGSEEEFWQKPFVEVDERVKAQHTAKWLRDWWNHSTPKDPGGDQVVVNFADDQTSAAATKDGSSLIKVAEPTTRISAEDQTAHVKDPERRPFPKHTTMTQSEAFSAAGDRRTVGMASAKPPTMKPPPPEKNILPKVGTAKEGGSTSSPSQGSTCMPKTHVVFLKVHKSASSTVMNILFRFGDTRNLSFALPGSGASQLYYPHYFMAAAVQGFSPKKDPQFHIMCHHMRFFQPEVARVMPNTSFYFSILRNPIHLMESSFAYYKGVSAFAKAKNLEEFLNDTSKFYNASTSDSHYAKNLMTFDFGYNHNGNFSAKNVQLMLRAIEAQFDLLLISEYFDESMVLLKEALCWDLDDVVSFPLNSRDNSTKSHLSKDTIEKIKSWNKLDWELYVHFNRTFWEKIDGHMGRERMQQEVRALKQKREQLAKICLQEGGSVIPKKIADPALAPLQYGRAKILGYNLKPGLDRATRQMCRHLVTPELQYSSLLYRKQFPQKTLTPRNPAHLPKLYNRRTV